MKTRAGFLAQEIDLIDVERLIDDYYQIEPAIEDPVQKVIFGTSGHRGTATKGAFNEAHIIAITQAIAEYRALNQITGPCFIGKDTHALSAPALTTVLEVLAANRVVCQVAKNFGNTPTPVISRAIIVYNQTHSLLSDGIVITPSHNPPQDGGIKYNAINGGPADTEATKWIENRANALLKDGVKSVKRITLEKGIADDLIQFVEYETDYVNDLTAILDLDLIRSAKLKLGVDPMGGAGLTFWQRIAEVYRLDLTIVNDVIDPTFKFMHLDHDEVIRMDCSSAHAMAGLLALKDQFDLSFGNDTDFDRHGIVTPAGLMNPNAYLSACVDYLFQNRPQWRSEVAIGKTIVTSSMIDRIAKKLKRSYLEYPVGFKWFAEGLFKGNIGFAGEESAGATFLRKNGQVWTTDKDGMALCLLAAEITAKTQKTPQQNYDELTQALGTSYYGRIQAPATLLQKQKLSQLSASELTSTQLAGDAITKVLTTAPANQAPIGGLKVETENGWFAARPSGTEDAYKIYAESFVSSAHLHEIQKEAEQLVSETLR